LALRHGDREGARAAFAQALEGDQKRLRRFVRLAAQVEELTFGQPRQAALSGYLSATRDAAGLDEEAFGWVWAAKHATTRLDQARRRIELGFAEDIDPQIQAWRASVAAWKPVTEALAAEQQAQSDLHAAALRQAIWAPIAPWLRPETRLLLLAPDGDLARFPFA